MSDPTGLVILIPLFPLDGWTILMKLLPPQTAYTLSRYQNESTYVLFGLVSTLMPVKKFKLAKVW